MKLIVNWFDKKMGHYGVRTLFSRGVFCFALLGGAWVHGQEAGSEMSFQEANLRIGMMPTEFKDFLKQGTHNGVYSFPQANGKPSVFYTGQNFRQTLMNDLFVVTNKIPRDSELTTNFIQSVLTSYFEFDGNRTVPELSSIEAMSGKLNPVNGGSLHRVPFKIILDMEEVDGEPEEVVYSSIQSPGSNLIKKMAGNDNKVLPHPSLWSVQEPYFPSSITKVTAGVTSDSPVVKLVQQIMGVLASNGEAQSLNLSGEGPSHLEIEPKNMAALTPDGLHLGYFLNSFLLGSLSFSQATGDYLSVRLGPGKGLLASFTKFKESGEIKSTQIAHHWDEAYGYAGGARNFADYQLTQIQRDVSLNQYDENGVYYAQPIPEDEYVSVKYEKNFGLVTLAAARDMALFDGQSQVKQFVHSSLGRFHETSMTGRLYQFFTEGRSLIHQASQTSNPEAYREYIQAYGVLIAVELEKVMAATMISYINQLLAAIDSGALSDLSHQSAFYNLAVKFSQLKALGLSLQFNPSSLFANPNDFYRLHNNLGVSPLAKALPAEPQIRPNLKSNLIKAKKQITTIYDFTEEQVSKW